MTELSHESQRLLEALQKEFPDLEASLGIPENYDGIYFLDLNLNGHEVVVEWKAGYGFGISASLLDPLYGEGPEEVFAGFDDALERVSSLLRGRGATCDAGRVVIYIPESLPDDAEDWLIDALFNTGIWHIIQVSDRQEALTAAQELDAALISVMSEDVAGDFVTHIRKDARRIPILEWLSMRATADIKG